MRGDNLRTLADRLRAAGFPIKVIRAIVSRELRVGQLEQLRSVYAAWDPPYWGPTDPRRDTPSENAIIVRRLNREREVLMQQALGADWVDPSEYSYLIRAPYELPFDVAVPFHQIQYDFGERRQAVYRRTSDGLTMPEDRDEKARIDREEQAAIARLLTPEQLLNYEIQSDLTSLFLRSRLASFKPTREEFVAIYKLQREIDLELGDALAVTDEEKAARAGRSLNMEAEIAKLLSPERYQQYRVATDSATQQVSRLALRFELPLEAVQDILALQQETQSRVSALRRDNSLSAAERARRLKSWATDAQTRAEALLGPSAYTAYLDYGGTWLRSLLQQTSQTR